MFLSSEAVETHNADSSEEEKELDKKIAQL